MYYYGARYYDPEIGRFTQADTIVPQPGDPQAFNRYAYVRNNPIRYTDPTGHSWLSKAWDKAKKWVSNALDSIGQWLDDHNIHIGYVGVSSTTSFGPGGEAGGPSGARDFESSFGGGPAYEYSGSYSYLWNNDIVYPSAKYTILPQYEPELSPELFASTTAEIAGVEFSQGVVASIGNAAASGDSVRAQDVGYSEAGVEGVNKATKTLVAQSQQGCLSPGKILNQRYAGKGLVSEWRDLPFAPKLETKYVTVKLMSRMSIAMNLDGGHTIFMQYGVHVSVKLPIYGEVVNKIVPYTHWQKVTDAVFPWYNPDHKEAAV